MLKWDNVNLQDKISKNSFFTKKHDNQTNANFKRKVCRIISLTVILSAIFFISLILYLLGVYTVTDIIPNGAHIQVHMQDCRLILHKNIDENEIRLEMQHL